MSTSSSDAKASEKQLLSGAELVQLRKKAGRALPAKKSKEFKPSGSWLEQKQIQSTLDEIKVLLEEQRVEKHGSLAKAEWNPQSRVAEVTCRIGAQWNTMGHERRGKLLLFPEEALFLLEMNKLQVMYDGVSMSIEQAFAVLLGLSNGCTLNEYRTYEHLVKQGYILLRHSQNVHVTRYEQKIRLHQHTLNQKQNRAKPKGITNALIHEQDFNKDKYKNVQVVDIIEDIPLKTQITDNRECCTETELRLELGDASTSAAKRHEHVNDGSQSTDRWIKVVPSWKDTDDIEAEDYSKPSTSTVIPQNEHHLHWNNSKRVVEVAPIKKETSEAFKKEKEFFLIDDKMANSCTKTNTAAARSHTDSSDIIVLDEETEPSVTNRSRQISESSSSELGSVKCEIPLFRASSKRKFLESDDRKQMISDLDSECEILEISTSTKKQKYSPRNIVHRLMDTTSDIKTDIKFHSNGLDWNQPSSSYTESNNVGKHRITNVQLKDAEIEIVPGVIDKAQEKKCVKQERSNDIEVIDLDDDDDDDDHDDDKDVKTSLSKKEEKMRILDSIPSVEGKFLIHLKAPPHVLLPPNVTPQKKDYYIQLWRFKEAGFGGRPIREPSSNNRQREVESQSETRINPWISAPPEQTWGNRQPGNHTWGTNFTNQNIVPPMSMVQTMWQQFTTLFPYMNNPMWHVNSFGMQLPWFQPQMNMWRPPWQYRGRSSWRRPYRGRGRGRYRPGYRRPPTTDNVSSSDAESETRNESSATIPFKAEDNHTVERIKSPESKLNRNTLKPTNSNDSEENKELVILDDDDNDIEPIASTSQASQFIRRRERRNRQKWKKRGGGPPPRKLQGYKEQLLSEGKAKQMVKQEDSEEEEEEEEDSQNAEAERKTLKLEDMKNWKDLKDTVSHVMQEVVLDSASSEEEAEEETSHLEPNVNQINSLVQPEDCISMDTVLSKLQIIRSVNVQEDSFCASEKVQKISFDVFLPNAAFRKANPGLPKYRIAVLGFQDEVPPLGELAKMMRQFHDDVPLVFAVVIPNSVTFFQLGSVNLPVEVMFTDII